MAAAQVFKVLTTFNFEIGQALVASTNLQSGLEGISGAAQQAQIQLARVGIGFAASLGIAGGGVVGILANVIRQFDSIEKQQIKLGGIFFANRGFIDGVNTANDALGSADQLMTNIARQADKFGLNEQALAQFASLAIGITSKEGISPAKNITFARNILKAAPQLGINPFEAQGQITRALLGGASTGDPAFRAIVAETEVFKLFAKKIGGVTKVTKAFNNLPTVERFELLNSAFGQFTQNSALLAAQANTLSSLFLRIKQSLFGFAGVFRSLGEVIVPLIKDALKRFLAFVKGPFTIIIGNLAAVFKELVPNLEQAVVQLQRLSDLSGNVKKAGFVALILTFIQFAFIARVLSKVFKFIVGSGIIKFLGRFVKGLGGFSSIMFKLGRVFRFLFVASSKFILPLLAILAIFDIISRAFAFAKIDDAARIPIALARISESIAKLTRAFTIVFKPVNDLFNAIARGISPVFKLSVLFEALATVLETVETVIVSLIGGLIAAMAALIGVFTNLFSGNFKKFSADEFSNIFNDVLGEFFKNVIGNQKFDDPPTSKTVVNINKVDIINNFKERIEPDRVAFTVAESLKKFGTNKTQGRGKQVNRLVGG